MKQQFHDRVDGLTVKFNGNMCVEWFKFKDYKQNITPDVYTTSTWVVITSTDVEKWYEN